MCIPCDLEQFWNDIAKAVKTGPLNHLADSPPLTFCGLELVKKKTSFGMTQDSYRANLPMLDKNDFFGDHKRYTNPVQLSKITRAIVGSCIWLCQTRFDIGFLTLKAATLITRVCQNEDSLRSLIEVFEQIYRILAAKSAVIWYHEFVPSSQIPRCQILAFSDAGLGSLEGSASVEAGYLCWGFPVSRDGVITCRAHVLDWFSRKMRRVAKSSTACEAAALCTTSDLALWFRCAWHEALYGSFVRDAPFPSDGAPLVTPFALPDLTVESVHYSVGNRQQHSLVRRTSLSGTEAAWFLLPRIRPGSSSSYLDLRQVQHSFATFFSPTTNNAAQVHIFLMADSANSFSASHQANLRTQDRSTRLHLAYVRDLLNIVGFSYITFAFNIADGGTKHNGQIHLWHEHIDSNLLHIGFLTRKEFKSLAHLMLADSERRQSL